MNATLKAPPIATRSAIEVERTEPTRIETTLFDLVVALQAEFGFTCRLVAAINPLEPGDETPPSGRLPQGGDRLKSHTRRTSDASSVRHQPNTYPDWHLDLFAG